MSVGTVTGMETDRGNRSHSRKSAPASYCPPKIPHDPGGLGWKPATITSAMARSSQAKLCEGYRTEARHLVVLSSSCYFIFPTFMYLPPHFVFTHFPRRLSSQDEKQSITNRDRNWHWVSLVLLFHFELQNVTYYWVYNFSCQFANQFLRRKLKTTVWCYCLRYITLVFPYKMHRM
jgi:hypothetical protein